MTVKNLGIIGGGQLGSMMSSAAKKLDIRTVIYSDDKDAPAQNFCDEFIFGGYDDKQKILVQFDREFWVEDGEATINRFKAKELETKLLPTDIM